MNRGKLYIISGPSGSGKDSVLAGVFAAIPELAFSISSITRPMRKGEKEGEKYHFISREEFETMLKNDELLEHNVFVGNYYGTPIKPVIETLESGKDMMIEVDVNGADQIRKKMPEAKSFFVMPPSLEVLRKRLSGRGTDSAEIVEKRLNEAAGEMERAKEYDYVIINGELQDAVDEVVKIIRENSLK